MGGKKVLQSITTELSELCERFVREMNLSPKRVDDRVEFHGSDFFIYRTVLSDVEFLIYSDEIATAAFDERRLLRYIIKGRYLDGHKQVLVKTTVGRRVIKNLDESFITNGWTEEQIKSYGLMADVKYENPEEAYKFIKSHVSS